MSRNRMEAFSDGVLAIIITVMVLKLKTPESINFTAMREVFPTLLAYILSYIYIGIYWGNHHHLVSAIQTVSGAVLWRNLHWLFWMSLLPTATEWAGLHPLTKLPAILYGVILLMCAISYHILQNEIIRINGKDSKIAKNIGKDIKGNGSILAYALAVVFAFYLPLVSYAIYFIIALAWVVPDNRLE